MPLVGLVDPSHSEREEDQPGRYPKWYPLDEVLGRALAEDPNWAPWTYEMLALAIDQYQERGDHISTTALLAACPRAEILKRKLDFIGTVDGLYIPLRGTAMHSMLQEQARTGSVAEVRFITHVDGTELSGTPDLITSDTVWDYKQTESPPRFDSPYKHHTLQVQFNRFIVNNAEAWVDPMTLEPVEVPWDPRRLEFEHLVLVYLGPKYPIVLECRKTVTRDTPRGATRKVKVPDVWTDKKVLDELTPRLHTFVNALESFPKFPRGAERVWGGEPDWRCPGYPICRIPDCLAKRYPDHLMWDNPR